MKFDGHICTLSNDVDAASKFFSHVKEWLLWVISHFEKPENQEVFKRAERIIYFKYVRLDKALKLTGIL